VEVSQLHPAGRHSIGAFYSVALTNNYQQADTGTKIDSFGKNDIRQHDRVQGIPPARPDTYRGL